jgi:hypothetical protein
MLLDNQCIYSVLYSSFDAIVRIARELDRKLREEQDIAYQESLFLDQLKVSFTSLTQVNLYSGTAAIN